MINAIDQFNSVYSTYLNNPTTSYETQSKQAADKMLQAVQHVTDFIRCNKNIVKPIPNSPTTYEDIVETRQILNQQTDILKSMNGAPKPYNGINNIYDEYRASYNMSVYVSILVCILAVFAIYFYFRSL